MDIFKRQYKNLRMDELRNKYPILKILEDKNFPDIIKAITYVTDQKLLDQKFEELEDALKEITEFEKVQL